MNSKTSDKPVMRSFFKSVKTTQLRLEVGCGGCQDQ